MPLHDENVLEFGIEAASLKINKKGLEEQ